MFIDSPLGVVGKLFKQELQLRGEIVSLITQKLRTFLVLLCLVPGALLRRLPGDISKNEVNRMYYKNFDQHITRKHGIVIEGWPLRTFDNPSAIGSQVELKVLLGSWETGAMRFRKMSNEEHMAWVEGHAEAEPACTATDSAVTLSCPSQNANPDLTPAASSPAPRQPFNIINFESPSATPTRTESSSGVSKRPRKTRSDKGKPRKKAKASHIPGVDVFRTSGL